MICFSVINVFNSFKETHYSQFTIHNSLFTIHNSQKNGESLDSPFYLQITVHRSLLTVHYYYSKCTATVRPAITMLTMLISLMRMFRDGPEVSLKGSPTVSPTTVAL